MNFVVRKPWDLPDHTLTDENVYRHRQQHRREFLASMGLGSAGLILGASFVGCGTATTGAPAKEEPLVTAEPLAPPPPPGELTYGRTETDSQAAAEHTNFYEFGTTKATHLYVDRFQPSPWEVIVDGQCAKPMTFDLDDLRTRFTIEERRYRHRCVETWAMAVPWRGFALAELLAAVEPTPAARFVRFETFNRPTEAPNMIDSSFPWPYTEGLTLAEATNELAFLATGVYGDDLPKQHGAPVRLVVPWKYGFKSGKSIVRITLTEKQPGTFWNIVNPREYGFEANVDPNVPHPRWSQRTEWMLGTRERFPTVKFNGYGDYVAKLYA